MLENNAINYLHEMGIDIWIPRSTLPSLSRDEESLLNAISIACQISIDQLPLSQPALEALLIDPLAKKQFWQSLKDKR